MWKVWYGHRTSHLMLLARRVPRKLTCGPLIPITRDFWKDEHFEVFWNDPVARNLADRSRGRRHLSDRIPLTWKGRNSSSRNQFYLT
jgi:hypothetical protein